MGSWSFVEDVMGGIKEGDGQRWWSFGQIQRWADLPASLYYDSLTDWASGSGFAT